MARRVCRDEETRVRWELPEVRDGEPGADSTEVWGFAHPGDAAGEVGVDSVLVSLAGNVGLDVTSSRLQLATLT